MSQIQSYADKLAIALSSLCVVHCVITPILIIALPSLGALGFLEHESFHKVLIYFVVPIGLIALTIGYRHHQSSIVYATGLIGIAILMVAGFAGHEILGEVGEVGLTIIASCAIVFAHIRNFKLRQLKCAA